MIDYSTVSNIFASQAHKIYLLAKAYMENKNVLEVIYHRQMVWNYSQQPL